MGAGNEVGERGIGSRRSVMGVGTGNEGERVGTCTGRGH
jgi:hypothetical protein